MSAQLRSGIVVLFSGGMDSTTLAYMARMWTPDLHLLSVDYGQRHERELEFAARTADKLCAEHVVLDLPDLHRALGGSALTSGEIDVPEGHYTAESMKATVVPNRNMIMLAIAAGYAISHNLVTVATAVHAGDHAIYPDCRPEFISAVRHTVVVANEGFHPPYLAAPFLLIDKTAIARIGNALGVPWLDTWSCYKGGTFHCGHCGTCVERREAFTLAGINDPTRYYDSPEEITSIETEEEILEIDVELDEEDDLDDEQ